MESPPARSTPRPSTVMLPSVLTSALRSAITHGWPPGLIPLTMFATPPTLEGTTPIPPSNLASLSSAADEIGNTRPSNSDNSHACLMGRLLWSSGERVAGIAREHPRQRGGGCEGSGCDLRRG